MNDKLRSLSKLLAADDELLSMKKSTMQVKSPLFRHLSIHTTQIIYTYITVEFICAVQCNTVVFTVPYPR